MKLCLIFAVLLLEVTIHAAPITNATGQVSLAWDASAGTNVIARYKIYWGVATRTYTNSVSAGTNLTCTVSNLVRGRAYFFTATALDASGYGERLLQRGFDELRGPAEHSDFVTDCNLKLTARQTFVVSREGEEGGKRRVGETAQDG